MRYSPAKTRWTLSIVSVIGLLSARSLLGDEAPKNDTADFNFAKINAHARVVYVSSGSLRSAKQMIDNDLETSFRFSSSDPHPTVIVELAGAERLHRATATYQMEDSRLDIYLLNELTGEVPDLLGGKYFASMVNPAQGKAAFDFEPRGARYVAFRWTRKKMAKGEFQVAELGAYCAPPVSLLDLARPPSFAQSGIRVTGGAAPDFSNALGTLADPPTIGLISP